MFEIRYCVLFLWLVIHTSMCIGQDGTVNTLNFDVEIKSSYFTSNYYFNESISASCSTVWRLESLNLLDSIGNKIGNSNKWIKGAFPIHRSTKTYNKEQVIFSFRDIPKHDYYLLNQEGESRNDTLTIEEITKGEISFELYKEETQKIQLDPTFFDIMEDGDTLRIKYDSYACGTYSYMEVIKDANLYSVNLEERMGGSIIKNFTRTGLDKEQISIIGDFELDCSRDFDTQCNDANTSYSFGLNGKTKNYFEQCHQFGGYFIVKQVLFMD